MAKERGVVVLCLDDDGQYVQATRKRFTSVTSGGCYARTVGLLRKPVVVAVPPLPCDEEGYPIKEGGE